MATAYLLRRTLSAFCVIKIWLTLRIPNKETKMAIIDLLPAALGGFKKSKPTKGKLPPNLKKFRFIPILITILLAGNWMLLAVKAQATEKTRKDLDSKLQDFQVAFQKLEELTKNKKELEEKIGLYKGAFEKRVSWSEKLSLVGSSLPEQIWLTQVYTEKRPANTLVIKGSATSMIETEIINSVSQYLGRLKENSSFSNDFSEITLGSMVAEKRGNLTIMNFGLSCSLR